MNSGRSDLRLIALCTVPIVVALLLWMNYVRGGGSPFSLPSLNLPYIGTSPSLPSDQDLPMGMRDFLQTVRENLVLAVTAVTVGIVTLIMLSGIWVESVKTRRDDDETYGRHDSDAPWLDDVR